MGFGRGNEEEGKANCNRDPRDGSTCTGVEWQSGIWIGLPLTGTAEKEEEEKANERENCHNSKRKPWVGRFGLEKWHFQSDVEGNNISHLMNVAGLV